MSSGPVKFSEVVRRALDPVLMPYGFSSGQGGDDPHSSASLTFCAAYDRLSPAARVLAGQDYRVGDGYCVDIIVEGNPAEGLTRVDYEGRPIDSVLDEVGLTADADRCRAVPFGDLASDIDAVQSALTALFSRTAD